MKYLKKNVTRHPQFNTLTKTQKELIDKYQISSNFLPKQFIYKKDSNLKYVYFVYKGSILIGRGFNHPNEMAYQLILKPTFLGVESIMIDADINQYAKTLSDVYCLKIPVDIFKKILVENYAFHNLIQKQLLEFYENIEKKYELLTAKKADERLILFLQEIYAKSKESLGDQCVINLHMSHLEISHYLQCSRQTVTMGLSKLRELKLIDYKRNKIEIKDIKKLKKWKGKLN